MAVMKRCRSCRAPVLFVQLDTGAWMPVDARPDDLSGTVLIPKAAGESARVVGSLEERLRLQGRGLLYVSHFATCPYARQHRRRR